MVHMTPAALLEGQWKRGATGSDPQLRSSGLRGEGRDAQSGPWRLVSHVNSSVSHGVPSDMFEDGLPGQLRLTNMTVFVSPELWAEG